MSTQWHAAARSVGDLTFTEGMRRGLVESRDELRSLPPRVLGELRESACSRPEPHVRIIDCQLSVRQQGGLVESVPKAFLRRGVLGGIVILEASEEVVLRRRLDAPNRKRTLDLKDVTEQQDFNRDLGRRLAKELGVVMHQIDCEGPPGIAATALEGLLRTTW